MAINKIMDYPMPEVDGWIQNKVNWDIVKEDAVLLIHDMQVYFTEAYNKNGKMYQTMVENIKKIRQECKNYGIPVVYSAQPEGQTREQRGLLLDFWGTGIPAGESRQDIINALYPEKDDILITKWRYSAFENTELSEFMESRKKHQLVITGVYAHIGCLTTSVIASMKNIKAFMISDALGDFSEAKHKMALEYVSQLSGMVLNTNKFLNSF